MPEQETKQLLYTTLGDLAQGNIDGSIETHERLDEFTERVARGEFHVKTEIKLPCGCIDGRCGCKVRPDAAGGTMTMVVADDLLEQKFAGDGTTADMTRNVFWYLREQGYEIGDHTAEIIHGEDNSGCGANDQLKKIYGIIADKQEQVRALAGAFGIVSTDEDHAAIIAGAARRTQFSTGREVLGVMVDEAGEENIDVLRGDHKEVVAVINHRRGTTLDRDAVAQAFGENYEAFNVDVWAFEEGARALYPNASEAEIRRTVTAMVYYNIATTLALCGPNMRMVTLAPEDEFAEAMAA